MSFDGRSYLEILEDHDVLLCRNAAIDLEGSAPRRLRWEDSRSCAVKRRHVSLHDEIV